MATVGVDIGGSSIKAVRLNGTRTVSKAEHRARNHSDLSSAIQTATQSIGLTPADTLGLCLPGITDQANGNMLRCHNLPFLVGANPKRIIQAATGCRVSLLMTDAAAWGLGIWHNESIEGRLLVLAIGTGIGAALAEGGKLITLDGITPGHIGMLDVSMDKPNPPTAADGSPGVLEAYIGGRAFRDRFGPGDLTQAVQSLSPDDESILALIRALRICHAIYKPNAIRLAGGIGTMLRPHLQTIDRQVRDRLTSVAIPDWTLECIDDAYLAAQGVAIEARNASPE